MDNRNMQLDKWDRIPAQGPTRQSRNQPAQNELPPARQLSPSSSKLLDQLKKKNKSVHFYRSRRSET